MVLPTATSEPCKHQSVAVAERVGARTLCEMRPLTIVAVIAFVAACSHTAPPARATPSPQTASAVAAPQPLSAAQLSARNTLLAADSALSLVANHSLHDAIASGASDDVVMLMPTLAHSDTLTSVVPIQYLSFWRRESNNWKLVAWLISAGGADAPATAPAACAHPGAPTYTASHDSTAIATVRAADLDFSALSVKSGAGPAFGEFVALDGASIGTGATEITCGRDAVAKSLAPLGPGALTWAPRVADAAPSGDLAFTSGDAIIKDSGETSYSNYLTVWKRQADGQWRVVADGGNSAPAPASH